MARRLFKGNPSPFNVYLLQTLMEDTVEDEGDALVVRYNLNGIELNEEGFQKVERGNRARADGRKFSDAVGQGTRATLFRRSSARRHFEPIVIRKGFVRQLLPGGKSGAQGNRSTTKCAPIRLLDLARKKVPTVPAKS